MKQLLSFALVVSGLVPASRAQAPCYAENDTPNYNSLVSMGGPMVGVKFVLPLSMQATRLEVFTGNVTTQHDLGIWSHDPVLNQPLAALGSGSFTVSSTVDWQGANTSAAIALVAGQTYWFVWTPNGGGQASVDVPMATPGQTYRGSFDGGQSWNGPFQFNDRHWKFRLYGACNPIPVVYCTAGTTSSGCVAQISASGQPDVAYATACVLTVSGVEGQKTGLLFYGLDTVALPWCTIGGSSFLCVKPPTMRTQTQSSGGTFGLCDGNLVLDWSAFQLNTPGALGAPWSAGDDAFVQAWFRDPPSCKSTSLSDAVELTWQP